MNTTLNVFPDVYAEVRHNNGNPLSIDEDGFIGRFVDGELLIRVYTDRSDLYVFYPTYREGELIELQQHQPAYDVSHYYRYTDVKKASRYDCFHTEYPFNTVYVMTASSLEDLTIWCVSVASQRGDFFLVSEVAYRPHRPGVRGVMPISLKLGNVCHVLRERYPATDRRLTLETNIESYADLSMLDLNEGKVAAWSKASGYGFLLTYRGGVRVHWENIRCPHRLAHLEPGQAVRIDQLHPAVATKGRKAHYALDALGVCVV